MYYLNFLSPKQLLTRPTLESGIDVGQGLNVGPGTFGKNNKHRALNKRRDIIFFQKKIDVGPEKIVKKNKCRDLTDQNLILG